MEFIAEAQDATPVAAEIRDGTSRRSSRAHCWIPLQALERFAFQDLACFHFEVVDRYLTNEDGRRAGLPPSRPAPSYETGLRQSEEMLFSRMKSACRRCITLQRRYIATGIYPALNTIADFWGTAGVKEGQHLRPNEALHWHAIPYWKAALAAPAALGSGRLNVYTSSFSLR
jgi:hypothetical protein